MKSSDNKVVRGLSFKIGVTSAKQVSKCFCFFLRIAMSDEYMNYKDQFSMKLKPKKQRRRSPFGTLCQILQYKLIFFHNKIVTNQTISIDFSGCIYSSDISYKFQLVINTSTITTSI